MWWRDDDQRSNFNMFVVVSLASNTLRNAIVLDTSNSVSPYRGIPGRSNGCAFHPHSLRVDY